MTGTIGILNVGAGDTKLSFDPKKPAERKRAAKVVTDMLERGFAILVEVGRDDKGPLYRRAEAFDPDTCEYIIVGTPEDNAREEDEEAPAAEAPEAAPEPRRPRRKKGGGRKRVAAASTSAVAVSRSAGG